MAVECLCPFGDDPWPMLRPAGAEGFDQSSRRLMFDEIHFDAGTAKPFKATSCFRVWVAMSDDHSRRGGVDDGIGAWASPSLMVAGFQGDVERAAAHAISRSVENENFSMWPTIGAVMVRSDDISIGVGRDASNQGIRLHVSVCTLCSACCEIQQEEVTFKLWGNGGHVPITLSRHKPFDARSNESGSVEA